MNTQKKKSSFPHVYTEVNIAMVIWCEAPEVPVMKDREAEERMKIKVIEKGIFTRHELKVSTSASHRPTL